MAVPAPRAKSWPRKNLPEEKSTTSAASVELKRIEPEPVTVLARVSVPVPATSMPKTMAPLPVLKWMAPPFSTVMPRFGVSSTFTQ